LKGLIADYVEDKIQTISSWKDVEILELNVQPDHVHIINSIPPKLSVSDYVGIIKGKSAIQLFKTFPNLKKKPYWGNHFWQRGYFVSTIGIDEEKIRRYVKYQEGKEKEEQEDGRNFRLF